MTGFMHIHDLDSVTGPCHMDVVWVPGEQVACHRVTVPPVAKKKWLTMVPWLVEERVLERPEDLVVAAGEKDGENTVPVAAVSAKVLAHWRKALNERAVGFSALVPDFFALPWQAGTISMLIDGDRVLMRSGEWEGAAGPAALLLPLAANQLDASALTLAVYYRGQKPGLAGLCAEGPSLEARAEFHLLANVYQTRPSGGLVLAKGAAEKQTAPIPLSVKVAMVLMALCLVTAGAAFHLETRQVERQAQALDNSLKMAYRQYFGEEYDFPADQFQRVVSARAGANPADDQRLTALRQFSLRLARCPGCRVDKLRINDSGVELSISGAGAQTGLEQIAAQLEGIQLRPAGDAWQVSFAGFGE